jgi:hypothetical protein
MPDHSIVDIELFQLCCFREAFLEVAPYTYILI